MPRPSHPTLPHPSRAHSGGIGPGPELLGLGCRTAALAHVTKPQEIGARGMPALSTSVACVIMPLTLHTCWLLEASTETLNRASPRTPGLTPTMPRGLPAPWVSLLPENQTLVEDKLEPISPQTWGLSPGDAACQDGICVFGDGVANPGSQSCGLFQALLGTALPPEPQKCYRLRVLWWTPPLLPASQWAQVPVAGCQVSGP